MPKKKKTANEMTTEELAKRVFPKKVRDELYKIAHEGEDGHDSDSDSSSQKESNTD